MTTRNVSPADAKRALGQSVAVGQQIILAAAMVGDGDDFAVWSQKCRDWTRLTGTSLAFVYGEEAAGTFQRATVVARPGGTWQQTLAAELERIQQVVEMLSSLSEEVPDTAGRS